LEKWSYRRNGAVEGPVGTDQLAALYEAGEITDQTLVRSTSAGGGWRRYEDVAQRRHLGLVRRFPRAVTKLWPWFVIGTPLVGGLVDVFLVQSKGHEYIATNSWIGHGPIIVNLAALGLWLVLIWREIRRADRRYGFGEMVLWLVAAPVYQAFSWWATALVSMLISLSAGYDMPECDSDVVQAQVRAQFERLAAKKGDAGASAVALTDMSQQWGGDRIRMCAAKLDATTRSYSVRYKIEDKGNWLFRNTMHGLYVTTFAE
jgi:4-amino-4-deoxy-L-arabinose transferase-like glycosyltransferase